MRRRLALLGVTAVVATVGAVAVGGPAHAVAGLQHVTAASSTNSTSPKSLVVRCPAGTAAIGGGAYITGATGEVHLQQVVPTSLAGSGVLVVRAEEDPDGYAGTWRVDATAVCVTPPSGLEYVRTSVTDPALVWATASCGAKRIIGSGFAASSTAEVKATGFGSLSSNRAYVSVEPSRVAGAVTPLTGTAVAVCATAALPGLVEVMVDGALNSTDGKSAVAACPAGTQVIGVGGDLWRQRANTILDDWRIVPAGNSVMVTGYEDQIGNPLDWVVSAWAFCAT